MRRLPDSIKQARDVRTWWHLPTGDRDQCRQWLSNQGIPTADMTSVKVGRRTAKAIYYRRDHNGRILVNDRGEPATCTATYQLIRGR